MFNKIYCTVILATLSIGAVPQLVANELEVVLAQDVSWGYLNPQRGDKSPGAADLWGDRTADTETGMLVRFDKGFSSPPHIHNITYRGIVINGLMHNAHPSAAKSWLPAGSFWTQPAGQDHVTAANADKNLIYLEIDHGPYLVKPSSEKFDNGEHSINIHSSNLVWLNHTQSSLIDAEKVSISYLWQKENGASTKGALLKLQPGFSGQLNVGKQGVRGVVISGNVSLSPEGKSSWQAVQPGSYFRGNGENNILLNSEAESIVYVRFSDTFVLSENKRQ